MKFGLDVRGKNTGADLAVRIVQIATMLPVLFTLVASGYYPLTATKNVFTYLFGLGASVIPRAWMLALSALYRQTASEIAVCAALLIPALAYGLLVNRFLRGDAARRCRVVLLALIAADLIVRLLPLRFNLAFGLPTAIAAFLIRLGCLALVWLDLRAAKQS